MLGLWLKIMRILPLCAKLLLIFTYIIYMLSLEHLMNNTNMRIFCIKMLLIHISLHCFWDGWQFIIVTFCIQYYSAYLDWRPHEGSDNPTYVFVDTRQIDIPAEDYYTIIHIQLREQRKLSHVCVCRNIRIFLQCHYFGKLHDI